MARILVVDDDPLVADVLAEILTTDGHQVLLANDVAHGINLTKSQALDLAMVALEMPGGQETGFELLQRIKEHNPSIAVIIMTGAGSQQRVVAALRGGAQDFIEKPFTADEVTKRVETALAQQHELGQHEQRLF